MQGELPPALWIRGACKAYGRGKKRNAVLKNLNMTVPRGAIYGFLGASGSGKTTLLAAVAGIRSLDAGDVRVLGAQAATGPAIGYMPQEVALIPDFTIKDTIDFFGRVMGMTDDEIGVRLKELSGLLDLPSSDRLVSKLSGGQQRRVSLAVALLHDPELLILDEPTVGLDPILRQRIWDYLMQITRNDNKTVIITTHYIEEARQSDVVGLMRGGQLLAEASPAALLAQHGCSSLEQLFLRLSQKQHAEHHSITPEIIASEELPKHLPEEQKIHDPPPTATAKARKAKSLNVMHALIGKNVLRFVRNPGTVAFGLGFAIIQVTLFFVAIGTQLKGLPVAVVNDEVRVGCGFTDLQEMKTCDMKQLSCRFLATLKINDVIRQVTYLSVNDAEAAVRKGQAWGVIQFASNFSASLEERSVAGRDVDDGSLDNSEIQVRLDMSDGQVAEALLVELRDSFKMFFDELLTSCDLNTKHAQLPIQFNTPIFGNNDYDFQTATAPGVLITVLYFLGTALTCFDVLTDRAEGSWDRTVVSGVRHSEVLIAHAVFHTLVVFAQTAECVFLAWFFNVDNNGSFFLFSVMLFLGGLCGMFYGLLVSVGCNDIRTANLVSMGNLVPMVIFCGVLWPVQGIPWGMRQLSEVLPLTQGIIALHSIMGRGHDLSHSEVAIGFATLIAWSLGALLLAIIILARKH